MIETDDKTIFAVFSRPLAGLFNLHKNLKLSELTQAEQAYAYHYY